MKLSPEAITERNTTMDRQIGFLDDGQLDDPFADEPAAKHPPLFRVRQNVVDLKPWVNITGTEYAVSDMREVRAGSFHILTCRLSDATGTVDAAYRPFSDFVFEQLTNNPVVWITGTVEGSGKYAGQVNIAGFKAVTEYDEEALVQALPEDHGDLLLELDAMIGAVGDGYLRSLLRLLLVDNSNLRDAYVTASAAKRMHHAYRGGLLRHSVEVARLCKAVARDADVTLTLDTDLLVTCALLHDIGKVYEMEHGLRRGTYTDHGNLIGHVTDGFYIVRRAIEQIDEFPPQTADHVGHVLLAHHDRLEFGSPKVPMLPEARILASCDLISAELDKMAREAGER